MDLFKDKWMPMLLGEVSHAFDSQDYIFEVKYDGIRAIILIDENVTIKTRNGLDITDKFEEFLSFKDIFKTKTILDGEIVSFSDNNFSFSNVLSRLHGNMNKTVVFMCFDILCDNNKLLINLPLLERKNILNKYKDNNIFIKSKVIYYSGIKLFDAVKALDLEGIVAKKKDSKYQVSKRTNEWLKIKNYKQDYFYIKGYRVNLNNSITVSLYDSNDEYVGMCVLYNKHILYNDVINKKRKNIRCLVRYSGKIGKKLRDAKIV